jgi:hypothetical protein
MNQRTRILLNGQWELVPDPDERLEPHTLDGQPAHPVQVPAPWQSQSEELRRFPGPAWYVRQFDLPPGLDSACMVLGFGAVDYLAQVWLNDQYLGEHEGGYLPFEFDVTRLVRPQGNRLVVRVEDDMETFPEAPHGKQSWYGLLSGIWQPVWLEDRPPRFIQSVRITPEAPAGRVSVQVQLGQPSDPDDRYEYQVYAPNGELAAHLQSDQPAAELHVPDPILWDIARPNLYRLVIRLKSGSGGPPDTLEETFGFRSFEALAGQLWLNGRPIYLRGALDQDYYPDLISTPPSLDYIENQFRQALEMGLNCLRLHIKIADPRYYQAADRVGILIWSELPNWQNLTSAARQRARETLAGMIARDWNHPSIVIWTLINESWGIDLTDPDQRRWLVEAFEYMKALDPHRLVVGNSACWGNAQVVTDIADFHYYTAIPDHYRKWRAWVRALANRPTWSYVRPYPGYKAWKKYMLNPWQARREPPAPEVQVRGDEPILVSEFGNWGLPDLEPLYEHYGGEPWWFETGLDWGEGVVYPHGVESRFHDYHLTRSFPDYQTLARLSQEAQYSALKYEIEQIRLHPTLAGYVITEFTDVHWEANGLLDMVRTPKTHYHRLPELNADDLIIPDWSRLSFWAGETAQVRLLLSHYSQADLSGSRMEWRLELDDGELVSKGSLSRFRPIEGSVTRLGRLRLAAPMVEKPRRALLSLRLIDRNGELAARSSLDLFFYPPRAAQPARRIYAPGLEEPLTALGYQAVEQPMPGVPWLTTQLSDEEREFMLGGEKVIFLAEDRLSLRTHAGGIRIQPRDRKVWQGDWASSLSWIHRDRLFQDLPGPGLVDFAFAGITPETVITGLGSLYHARSVHAALAVGWIHRTAALIAELPIGRGRLMVSTFRLSKNLASHPLAAWMVDQMVDYMQADG